MNPPYSGLVFILSDHGYDVWLGNNRGNGYSMDNIYYTPNDDEFWDFSFDEMGKYDWPSQIDYVLNYTGAQKITYIGHSEGTIQAFIGFLLYPSYVEKINIYIALAPVAYVYYIESLLIQAMAAFDAAELYQLLGIQEFDLPGAIAIFLPGVCAASPQLCEFDVSLICGPTTYLNNSRMSYYANYEPNPTSVKNMVHWTQGVQENVFQMYDYGDKGNMQHYNQSTPPKYDLTKFPTNLPTALFCGGEDYLADPKDVQHLLALLPVTPYVHYEPTYAHEDPLIGDNAYQRIYPLILQLIANSSMALPKPKPKN